MSQIEILLTDSSNVDFQKLAFELEKEQCEHNWSMADIDQDLNKTESLASVLVMYESGLPVACGAIRQYDTSSVEIKHMYVLPFLRRKNLASQILTALEFLAKEMKFKYCFLAAGKNQLGAISFYSKNGYKQMKNFGKYTSNNNICFRKRI